MTITNVVHGIWRYGKPIIPCGTIRSLLHHTNDAFDDIVNVRKITLAITIVENLYRLTFNQFIGETITISKEERSKITTLMSDQSSITLLFKDNQLKGYLIPEKVEASFKQFPGEKISENNAELKLVSSSFLSIPSDGDTQISIAYQNGVHWMLSKINTAMVEIFIIESLQLMQNNQLLL